MSAQHVAAAAEARAFHPRGRFGELALDHVSFDQLTGRHAFESVTLRDVTADATAVAIIGPIGAGKSSLIAAVCSALPNTHVALRVPVTGADDPTQVSTVAAMALSSALAAFDLETYQREALEHARADHSGRSRTPIGIAGGRLGGGPIPAELNVELGSLREEHQTNRLAGERLAGLDRLVTILVARDLQPVFVLEDTEAAIGGGDRTAADAFFDGPMRAFSRELDAACMIAVQEHIADVSAAFRQLAPGMRLITLPAFDDAHGRSALAAIIDHRLGIHELDYDHRSVLGDDALELLVAFYHETDRSLRHTLAALQSAAEHATDMSAELVRAPHVHAATQEWRPRLRDLPR